MKTKAYKYWPILMAMFMTMTLIGFEGVSRAADDDIPFFSGATGIPNVLFIFDNSDSMQDCPYPRKDGNTYRPSTYWRRGVTVDDDGTIAEDGSGNIIYDNSKYVTTDEELTLPGVNPPNLPGLGSSSSAITYIAGGSSNRIYDSNVDWTYFDVDGWAKCAYTYRYWKVKITDDNGVEQIRNIYHYSSSGYWTVFNNIDYTGAQPYTYELMAGQPGEVTYKNESNLTLVYDRNFDWSTITNWSDFSNTYRYRKLEITAGTNAGEVRNIYSRNTSYGYWQVDAAFPEPCDHTTRYKILGSPDDSKYASGGNHPDSKLYQAKKALKTFLESEAIKSCKDTDEFGNCIEWRYFLNMGFATYMSARVPRVRAKYYRKRAGTETTVPEYYYIRGYYKRTTNHSTYEYHPTSDSEFEDDWGGSHTGVTVGYTFDRLYQEGQCSEQTIHYTVTAIEHAPTDSLPNQHRFRFNGDYVQYSWQNTNVDSCVPGPLTVADLPDLEPNWTKVVSGDPCFANQNVECIYVPETTTTTTDWYQLYTWQDTYGDYNETDPDTPRYINPTTLMVTPYKGHCSGIPGDDWLCTNPDPENTSGDGAGDWTLVTVTLENVPIDSSGTLGNIEPNTFDYSYFRYPSDGTADRPHAWSYRKTADGYIYRYSTSYASTWGDAVQNDPFFPAAVGDEKANHAGDDHVVFVNLPEYDDADGYKGDDVTGQNVAKILNYINLARVAYPYDTRYDCTMMPYNPTSLAVNSSTAVAGTGTPLGASLENAKKYYESYFAQDDFTLGGCRNSYVIFLTDGLETCDGDPNAAAAALNTPLISDNESSRVKTYVIGFGLDDASKETLNALATAGGTGQAYFATNVEELVEVLAEDIMSEIVGDSYARSAPVLTRIAEEGDVLKIYSAYFDYPVWRGHLKAYHILPDGNIGDLVSEWASDCDGDGNFDGDAGCEIKTYGRGIVYTMVEGNRLIFNPREELQSLVNPDAEDIDGNSEVNAADSAAVVHYTLDPGYDSGNYKGTRDPAWPLGDIYNSAPVIVTNPNLPITYWVGYSAFKTAHASRPTVIYVGANDGMLHAINEINGKERWAYIPNCVLGTLHEFKEGHKFTVDLSIKGADIDTSAGCAGTGWKTVVVSGLRKGGNYYYALDVTDPDDPQPMWEITDGNMGNTWSIPAFGRINIDGTTTSVIFVGGGYSTDSGKGNRVYILKAADGSILKEFTVGGSINNIPSEILAVRYLLDEESRPVDYITRALVDPDLRGNIEVAYFGDTGGTLWKIKDLNTDSGWNPTLEELYTPENPRPIYHRPAIADVYHDCTRRFVLFGTGNENDPIDANSYDYFYEIEDREFDDSAGGPDEGSTWTGAQIADGLFRMTWMKTLPQGEKVFSDPTTYLNVVYFTTYQPQGGCAMGFSYLYGLTTTLCGTEGGEAGLEYGLDDTPLDPYEEKIDLGRSIASSPTLGPPRLYIQKPGGGGEGLGPPVAIKIPTPGGQLLYWRES